ncbi:MAG TPA: hypothetical protein VLD19_17165 [Chitinophagaceae bacterium]|nr:hypothetical protein [Chitinophagaceae bacterium]
MKRILLLSSLLIGGVLANNAKAQFHVSVNIGVQPEWGPCGYDYAEYYYLPDIESYYCVPTRQFTWFDNGRWVTSAYLPNCYSNYDLYSGYKVVINERTPWYHFRDHRSMYADYRYRHDQPVIRTYRGYNDNGRYYDNRGWHRGWDKDRGRDYGRNDRGWNNGRGRDDDRGRGHGNGHGNDHGNGHGRWKD